MTPQEQIKAKLKEIDAIYAQCAKIAEENAISFYTDGPSYAMGGTYTSKSEYIAEYIGTPEEIAADPVLQQKVAELEKDEADGYFDELPYGWKGSSAQY